MAAWNDFNPVAKAARQSLQQAAGIKVLNRMFVVWIVAGYVLVLAPVNWCVFRLLGRVEWAWAAAPLIAVICTVVVIHMAQLDIGFVRARERDRRGRVAARLSPRTCHPLYGPVHLAGDRLPFSFRQPRRASCCRFRRSIPRASFACWWGRVTAS